MVHIGNDWDAVLGDAFASSWYADIREKLKNEYATHTVFPSMFDIYKALKLTSYANTKIVILGQDPYHNEGEACGLCFAVNEGKKLPPSLQNIFKELVADLGIYFPNNGNLNCWAEQGVLLLNTVLTVRKDQPLSHKDIGWQQLTDYIIARLNDRADPVIFLLWGTKARDKKSLITASQHYILEAPHPSPLSAYTGFFGSKPFSKANAILRELNKPIIDWQIKNI